MDFHKEHLLTIITEADLEEHLIRDINRLGARGYTITSVQGKGEKGVRNDLWSASSNIKIEVICVSDICEKLVEFLKLNYLKNYAMIVFISKVDVLRS